MRHVEPRLREPLFDVVKALMMLWVVWGHLGRYGVVAETTNALPYMGNAKIGVNMPVFFAISGYFAAMTFGKHSLLQSLVRCVRMVWPQVAFALVVSLGVLLAGGGGFSVTFRQIMTFWFLKCIAVIYFLSAVVFKVCKSDRMRWMVFGGIYLALLACPSCLRFVWWIDLVIHMLPYFVFGLMVLSRRELFRNNLVSILCGAFFLAVVFLEGNSSTNGMNFWHVPAHWRYVICHVHDFVTFLGRPLLGMAGTVFVLWAVGACLRMFPKMACLAQFGVTSLGVYVIHEWFLMEAGSRFAICPIPEWTRWPLAIVYFLICHCVVVGIKSNGWTRRLFFGR